MDLKQIYGKVVNNQLSYDEALRIVGYIEKVSQLLGLRHNFDTEKLLNKSLDLSFTEEDANELHEVLTFVTTRHEDYQARVDEKHSRNHQRNHSYDEADMSDEYRPRKKKGHHR